MPRPVVGGNSIIETTSAQQRGPLSTPLWAELYTFLAVAELGSVNAAASHLRIHRSKVMRQIKRLNDNLKQPLLVLSTKGAMLTLKGQELARQLRSLDQGIYSIEHDLRADDRSPEGEVRVGISDGLAFIFLVPALAAFSAKYPRIRVTLQRPHPYARLRESHTDIMVGFDEANGSDLFSQKLGTVHFIPFAGESYVALRGQPSLQNLADHHFVGTERYSGEAWEPWQSLVQRGRVLHSCNISITYAFMVKAGLGIGLLPTYNVCDRGFVPLDLATEVGIPVHAVVLAERQTSRAVRCVLGLLASVLGPGNGWLSPRMSVDIAANGDPIGYTGLLNLPPGGNAILPPQ